VSEEIIEKIKKIVEEITGGKYQIKGNYLLVNTENSYDPTITQEEAKRRNKTSILEILISKDLKYIEIKSPSPTVLDFLLGDDQLAELEEQGFDPAMLYNPEYRKKWRHKIPGVIADIEKMTKIAETTSRKHGIKIKITDIAHSPKLAVTLQIREGQDILEEVRRAIIAIHEAWQKLIPWIESKQREQLYGHNIVPWRTKTTWKKWQSNRI